MEIQEEIEEIKKEKNAIILAHNYQPKEIQEIADFIGDSLELCLKITKIKDKDMVVFCGVDFMAETAYILSPDKKILIPDPAAECQMAHMLKVSDIKKAKKKYPDAAVVLYVNTLAEAKAEADIICTSANAVEVVNSLDEDTIIFGPDRNLAMYVAKNTDKKIIPVPEDGHCYVHKMFKPEHFIRLKEKYPDAEILVHPECDPEVQELADHILSTGGMIRRTMESDSKEFIIGTEVDLCTRIEREVPNKKAIPAYKEAICEEMKYHSLKKLRNSLIEEKYEVKVPKKIAKKAKSAINRMIEIFNK
ncbi:quinolinate synthetase A [Methanothermus fervidus DSM 2088]|uniref:Quinolinate synthase n=1 Tax=Methanothermus fervidus (strain ATCC 43054 / DSM 2088 / JCM 10308 / V24 S) TaxID=523846 RepID=E3GZ14_METFV|nr:quinolinate synthetase A [Methanothermus fervidus DSM 2088]